MADTSWKPKRVSGGTADSTASAYKVELSIQCAETKKAIEEIIAENEVLQVKDNKDTTPPSLLILELHENPEETFSVIRDLVKVARGTEIFLTASKLDSAILLEAMRAGAKEFLSQPIQKKEVEDAFARFRNVPLRILRTTMEQPKKKERFWHFLEEKVEWERHV